MIIYYLIKRFSLFTCSTHTFVIMIWRFMSTPMIWDNLRPIFTVNRSELFPTGRISLKRKIWHFNAEVHILRCIEALKCLLQCLHPYLLSLIKLSVIISSTQLLSIWTAVTMSSKSLASPNIRNKDLLLHRITSVH